MNKKDLKKIFFYISIFLIIYFIPVKSKFFEKSLLNGFYFLNEYAKKHVLTCLIPAFFIAGALNVFINKGTILKYLGNKTKKIISYSIASISGIVLAVCSCTILPIFAGIRERGSGLGPAITFLYAGPAINVASIFLTMHVLGYKIGIARILFSIIISIIAGITMSVIFKEKGSSKEFITSESKIDNINRLDITIFFILLIGIIIINGFKLNTLIKLIIICLIILFISLIAIFRLKKEYTSLWLSETWYFTEKIIPYLFIGVFIAGILMPLIPDNFIIKYVGKNNITGNLFASLFGSVMYFSTLTEIPILQTFILKGMAKGPALALLLAGPSLSLPNMLVIQKILGLKKSLTYILLVIIYSTIAGLIFGTF